MWIKHGTTFQTKATLPSTQLSTKSTFRAQNLKLASIPLAEQIYDDLWAIYLVTQTQIEEIVPINSLCWNFAQCEKNSVKHCQRHNGPRVLPLQLALVAILTTRWRHLHQLQICPPDGATCIDFKVDHQIELLLYCYIALLALSVSIVLVSSSAKVTSVKSQQGLV